MSVEKKKKKAVVSHLTPQWTQTLDPQTIWEQRLTFPLSEKGFNDALPGCPENQGSKESQQKHLCVG